MFNIIAGSGAASNMMNPRTPTGGKTGGIEQQWLTDAMKTLIELVLDGSEKIARDVRNMLMNDLSQLADHLNVALEQDSKEVAGQMVAKMDEFLSYMRTAADYFKGGCKLLSRCKGFGWSAAATNWALRKCNQLKGVPFVKSFGLLARRK